MHLDEGEVLLHKYPTNYFSEEDRPYGGRLYITDERFVFLPHRLDSILGASAVSIPFTTVNDVASEASVLTEAELEDRRIPTRLRIETLSGTVHLFVVDDLDAAVEEAHEAIGIVEPDTVEN